MGKRHRESLSSRAYEPPALSVVATYEAPALTVIGSVQALTMGNNDMSIVENQFCVGNDSDLCPPN